MTSHYTQYYLRQSGGGLADIGPIYKASTFHQKGRGSIGNFFSGLFRYLTPIVTSGVNALKDQTVKTGANILTDIGHKPFKEILKEQGKAALSDLTQRGLVKLKKMQQGSGTKKKYIKRAKNSKKSYSTSKRKTKRFKKQFGLGRKQIGHGKKKKKSKKNKKKTRIIDIFNN